MGMLFVVEDKSRLSEMEKMFMFEGENQSGFDGLIYPHQCRFYLKDNFLFHC